MCYNNIDNKMVNTDGIFMKKLLLIIGAFSIGMAYADHDLPLDLNKDNIVCGKYKLSSTSKLQDVMKNCNPNEYKKLDGYQHCRHHGGCQAIDESAKWIKLEFYPTNRHDEVTCYFANDKIKDCEIDD